MVLHEGWATANNVSWSPDSKWLSYDMPNLDFNREVYIHAADNSMEPVNISMHPKSDSRAVWSKDGSKLGFLSSRNSGNSDVWFVWLKKADWEKTRRDWEEEEDEKSEKSEEVVIDFEDIHERLEQVTVLPGNEGDLMISNDGETFYFSTNNGSCQGFEGVKIDSTPSKQVYHPDIQLACEQLFYLKPQFFFRIRITAVVNGYFFTGLYGFDGFKIHGKILIVGKVLGIRTIRVVVKAAKAKNNGTMVFLFSP